jgi:dipeptidyl aminopeptidase/acylaminoacyl peptidase
VRNRSLAFGVGNLFLSLLFVLLVPAAVFAEEAEGDEQITYRMPPGPLAEIVDAPPTPLVGLSLDRQWMLLMDYPSLISIDELAEPELRLAGLRIRPRTNGPSRDYSLSALTLKRLDDLSETPVVGLPEGGRIGDVIWSPDNSKLAVTVTDDAEIGLWIVDVATGKARRLSDHRLNAAGGGPVRWLSDSRTLIVSAVPVGRGEAPEAPRVPPGPVVRQNTGGAKPARTYQDLLENAHDEALFEFYLTAQLHRIDVDGKTAKLGEPGILWDFEPSPDGRFLHVETLHRPFSYLVPAWRFPRRIEIWDMQGKLVHQVADLPLQESVPIPFGSVPTGPRSAAWRSDAPATFCWAEAQDGGDAGREAKIRDKIFTLAAPFDGEPQPLATLALRYAGIEWGSQSLATVAEWWWKTRTIRAWRIDPSRPQAEPDLLMDRSWEDRYNDPGDPLTVVNEWGRAVLFTPDGGRSLILSGAGASPEGDRPFLDRFDLKTKKTERLWRSEAPHYERAVTPADESGRRFVMRRESKDEPPNYFVRDVKTLPAARPHDGAGTAAAAGLGLPAGVQERRPRGTGHRFALPLRPRRLVVAVAVPDDGLRGARRPDDADHRRGRRRAERHLRRAARRQCQGRGGRGRPARRRRPRPRGDRRSLLRGVHDRKPAGALRSVSRRHRAQRSLQPDADAVRIPGRRAHAVAGRGYLLQDVAVHARREGQRADPADPRRGGQQHRNLPDAERALLQRPEGSRCHDASGDAAAREPRLPRARVGDAHVVGVERVARALRQERRAA